MKDFIMKHPIITFLLADSLIAGLFNTIRAFAPTTTVTTEEEKAVEEEDKNDNESILAFTPMAGIFNNIGKRPIENKEETV